MTCSSYLGLVYSDSPTYRFIQMAGEHVKRIPTELEINVLQHIADEDEGDHSRWYALINCALVCKAWTGYARGHLYYAVDMNLSRGKHQFESLREYTHLRPFLREFTWPQRPSLYSFSASDADIIKDVAPTVTNLRFRGVVHQHLEPWLKDAIYTFTNISQLDMTGSIFENWTSVFRVVSSFPFLATLAMPRTSTRPDNTDGPEISHPPPPSRLVHIKLASGCETETVSWICSGSPIANIQTVEAESSIRSHVLAGLLMSLGGSLRHLIIDIDVNREFLVLGSRRQNLS
jgi:hypothetical protein